MVVLILMVNEAPTNIIPKTLEQKETQVRLVDLLRAVQMRYGTNTEPIPSELLQLSPDDFQIRLDQEREKSKITGEKSKLLEDYEQFIQDLRLLRKEQSEQIKNEREQQGEDSKASMREQYLRSVSYSGKLQQAVLDKMENTGSTLGIQRIFTEEQIASAKNNDGNFLELVQFGMKRSPKSLFDNFEILEQLLPQESLVATLDLLAQLEPFSFVMGFKKFKHLFPVDRQKEILFKTFKNDQGASATILFLAEPGINELFTGTEKRELLLKAASTTYASSFEKARAELYVNDGSLTEDDVRDIIVGFVKRDRDGVKKAISFLDYFKTDEQRQRLKQEVIQVFTRPASDSDMWSLQHTQNLLTDDDRKAIIQRLVAEKPSDMGFHFELMQQYLSHDEISLWVKGAFKRTDWSLFHSTGLLIQLFASDYVSDADKTLFVEACIKDKPDEAMGLLEFIFSNMPGSDRKAIVDNLLLRVGVGRGLITIEEWLPIVCPEEAIRKQYLTDYLLRENSFAFIRHYNNGYSNNIIKRLFTDQEVKALAYKQLELGAGEAFSDYSVLTELYEFFNSDTEFKQFVAVAGKLDPSGLIYKIDELAYLYTEEELVAIIESHSLTSRGQAALVESIDKWATLLGNDFVWKFLQKTTQSLAPAIIFNLDKCMVFIPEDRKQLFVQELLMANPPSAIAKLPAIQRYLPNSTQETIIELAILDTSSVSFAPKTLAGFSKDVLKAKDETQRNTLVNEAAEIYIFINALKAVGLEDAFRKIQSQDDIPRNKEVEVLSTFYCFALLKEKDPERYRDLEVGNTFTSINETLSREIGLRLGVDRDFASEENMRFTSLMESPTAFLTYLLQYEESPAHKTLLAGMYESIGSGNYSDWKFGTDDEQSLVSLKEAKLLPQNLTLEQYRVWRKDEETSLQESLAADANSVAVEVRSTLLMNNLHLQIEALDIQDRGPTEILQEIQRELALVGQSLDQAKKKLASLKKQISTASDDQFIASIDDTEKEILGLAEQRNMLIRNKNYIRLANLKPEEIAVGYLLEGNESKRRDKPIETVVREVQAQATQEGSIVLDHIRSILASFRDQNQEKQNLTCTDSSNPKILIEIGDKPVASCQHYAHGSHNDCLLGYSDPNTKILFLRNERGNPVARCVFRLLSTPDGESALHIERVYSTTASQGVLRSIYTRAIQKANSMGVKLYTSYDSLNEQGITVESAVPIGFSAEQTSTLLLSESSRAPKVYVDSAGGDRSWGNFAIGSNREITQTQTSI